MVLTKTIEQNTIKQLFLDTYRTESPSLKSLIDYIQLLYDCGGPTEEEGKHLNDAFNFYRTRIPLEDLKAGSKQIAAIFGEDFIHSIPGHAYLKPYGYAGDFEIIDKMYLETTSENPKLTNWDLFHHQSSASTAVRNRKSFFQSVLTEHTNRLPEQCEVLDVASGPCRDLLEFMENDPSKNIHFDCVEADLKAILHATEINAKHLPNLTFYNQNIFRFKTEKKYDLIWSAGLFDYFDDKTFTKLVSRLIKNMKPGGELIIGNFVVGNPTEGYMELFLDWYLYHRSPEQLMDLAQSAGIADRSRITIDKEDAGVNLFMRIQF